MRLHSIATFAIALVLSHGVSQAATLTANERGDVFLDGRISEGDAERLIGLQQARAKGNLPWLRKIQLSSLGGSVSEAVKVASLVEAFRLDSHVPDGAACASACFLLYVAGSSRTAMGPGEGSFVGKVGVHRPTFDLASTRDEDLQAAENRQRSLMQRMRTFLTDRNVPGALIEMMMLHSSAEVYWLNDADLVSLGFHNPTYEELIVTRCGRSPDFARTLLNPSGSQGADNSVEKMDELGACQRRVITEVRSKEMPVFISKAARGWRPWSRAPSQRSSTKK